MAVLCRAFICITSVLFVTFYLEAAGSACKPGYHGRNCTEVCRYPNYGPLCQEACPCSTEYCHHVTGCLNPACKPGYHGRNCTEVCRYPNFGLLCQEECTCSKEYCHHITGCLNPDVTHNTTEGQSIIKETSKLVPDMTTLMNDNIDMVRTSVNIQSAIKRTQLVSKQSTVKNEYPSKTNLHKYGTISTTATSWAEYSKKPSEKVSMATFAVQENKKDQCQHLPLYVCFAFISLLAALNMFLLVRFRRNIRRAVKTEHVKKNEHNYVPVRSQLRSEAMYTIPERNEGTNYLEINENNMTD